MKKDTVKKMTLVRENGKPKTSWIHSRAKANMKKAMINSIILVRTYSSRDCGRRRGLVVRFFERSVGWEGWGVWITGRALFGCFLRYMRMTMLYGCWFCFGFTRKRFAAVVEKFLVGAFFWLNLRCVRIRFWECLNSWIPKKTRVFHRVRDDKGRR